MLLRVNHSKQLLVLKSGGSFILVTMADDAAAHAIDEKEKRRRKQANRMGKILAKVWNLKGSEAFQEERYDR